jgi:carboxyl-terminal processing protease
VPVRNTPAGGTTDVAEPILGRLIDREQPYQQIEPMHGARWVRRVAPRGPWQLTRP